MLVLLIFTVFSRLTTLSPIGFVVVVSKSMEPTIDVGDFAFYVSGRVSPGDIVVWCNSPTLCVVHRLVNETIDGYIITKGDNNPVEDPPIPVSWLKGRVVLLVPRELWVPTTLALASATIYRRARLLNIVDAPLLILLVNVVILASAVFSTVSYTFTPTPSPPMIYLSSAYIDVDRCTIYITYTGDMELLDSRVSLNDMPIDAAVSSRGIYFSPSKSVLKKSYEEGDQVVVKVNANLTKHGRLSGEYKLKVFGYRLEVRLENGNLVIENRNCFPITVNISYLYAFKPGDKWRTMNMSIAVSGQSKEILRIPEASYLYVDIVYRVEGVEWWQRLRIR